uniref:histidine kinase n=1 Tax=Oscillatoriales cyanobacterium SpSt-402 TaxID=2282168 RepID=A0A832H6U3_9CYAN
MNTARPEGTTDEVFIGGGEMGALMRSLDWSQTPLGSVESWSQSLKVAVNICLNSRFPMVVWWGNDLILLYNDAWQPILGNKHPQALCKPGAQVWAEIWDIVGIQLHSVLATGKATWSDDQLLLVNRYGYTEEAYFTYSYSPIFLETGEVGGAFTAVAETTQRVIGERRLATLRHLADQAGQSRTVEQACQKAIQTFSENSTDIPLAWIYLFNDEKTQAVLQEQTPLDIQPLIAPTPIALTQGNHPCTQTFRAVIDKGEAVLLENIPQLWGSFPIGRSQSLLQQAIVLPIRASTQESIVGMVVIGINPYRALDQDYRDFLDMTAGHVANAISSARAYEEERKRAEALAELDRAKTTFFSNISHEFRTPLTLMLSPLEDALISVDEWMSRQGNEWKKENRDEDSSTHPPIDPSPLKERLQLAHRNSLRLLKLVNTLLDFSRIEAGRVQAIYEPTDLVAFTTELASMFRSAIEQAGLQFIVTCEPLAEPVYVDRSMWEKIVRNCSTH